MDAHARQLQQHPLLQVQVVDLKVGRALAADEQVGGEPAVQVLVGAVGNQAENPLIVAQVGGAGMQAADAAFAAADDRGHQLIPHLQGLAGGVALDVLAKRHDFAGALVAENHRGQAEGVALPLVHVGAAHAAALYLDQNVVVAHFGHGEFLDLDGLGAGEHSDAGGGGGIRRLSGAAAPPIWVRTRRTMLSTWLAFKSMFAPQFLSVD